MRDDENAVPKGRETYVCEWVGHPTDEERDFNDNSEAWYESEGKSPPKACHICRAWRKEQQAIGIITTTCRVCGHIREFTPQTRIVHRQHEGDWNEYWEANKDLQLCRRCEEFPSRRRKLMYRDAEKKARRTGTFRKKRAEREAKESEAKDYNAKLFGRLHGKGANAPKRYDVPTYAEYYRAIPTPDKLVKEHGVNQLTHIMKDDHGWLKKIGTASPETVLNLAHRISNSTEVHVLQFTDAKTGYTVKYDTAQRICVVIRDDKTSPTRNRLVTVFPKDPEAAFKKLENKEWY